MYIDDHWFTIIQAIDLKSKNLSELFPHVGIWNGSRFGGHITNDMAAIVAIHVSVSWSSSSEVVFLGFRIRSLFST